MKATLLRLARRELLDLHRFFIRSGEVHRVDEQLTIVRQVEHPARGQTKPCQVACQLRQLEESDAHLYMSAALMISVIQSEHVIASKAMEGVAIAA